MAGDDPITRYETISNGSFSMVNVSENTEISDVDDVFLKLNHLINADVHHGYLIPVMAPSLPTLLLRLQDFFSSDRLK